MSNSIHSSFSRIWAAAMPTDGIIPTTYAVSSGFWTPLIGLISGAINLGEPTQIDDTEQLTVGGFKEYYAGRSEPVTATMKFSYNTPKLANLVQFLPKAVEDRTQPGYGNVLVQFEKVDGLLIRTRGYFKVGDFGDGEDDRQTIDASFQGSGAPIYVTVLATQVTGVTPTLRG